MKRCTKCKVEKNFSDFHKNNKAKDGFLTQCKECRNAHHRVYSKTPENKEKALERQKRWYEKNKDKILSDPKRKKKKREQHQKYKLTEGYRESKKRQNESEAAKLRKRKWYEDNKERIDAALRKRYEDNKEEILLKNKERYLLSDKSSEQHKKRNAAKEKGLKWCSTCNCEKEFEEFGRVKRNQDGRCHTCLVCAKKKREEYLSKPENLEREKERHKQWVKKNRERLRKYKVNHYKEKYKEDPSFRLHVCFSAMVYMTIRDKEGRSSFSLVNYSKEELIKHLEAQFDENMTWENYGKYWHIDHIIPRSYFDFQSYQDIEFKKCWSLANLRPLEASENMSKGAKLIEGYNKILEKIEKEVGGSYGPIIE